MRPQGTSIMKVTTVARHAVLNRISALLSSSAPLFPSPVFAPSCFVGNVITLDRG